MSQAETTVEAPKKSIYSNFDSNHESLSTDDSLFVTYDEETDAGDRKIQATQVVDCVLVAMWGRTKSGENFISLVHKSAPNTVKRLISEFEDDISGAEVSYLIIPGPESKKQIIAKTKAECRQLFGKEEVSTDEGENSEMSLRIEKHERPYESSSIVINGSPEGKVSILAVCPDPEGTRVKMSEILETTGLITRYNQ